MKKLFKALFIGFGIIAATVSCSKSFLDDPTPQNGDLTDNIIFSTKAGARSALTGIYWIFRSENYNGYGGLSTGPGILTNRGLQTTMFHFEMKGNDILDVYDGTYWWGTESTWIEGYYNRNAEGSRTVQIWDMFYKAINNANAVIQQAQNITDASEADKNQFIAEAKAIRAYSYFWLARVYQKTYAADPNAPGVPLYLEPASKGSLGNPRASLKDVYSLIIEDIEFAVSNLQNDRDGKYQINKNVAQAFAAMIYQELAMDNATLWDKVISNSQGAVAGYPIMSNAQYKQGFNGISNPEWIWGLPVPSDQSLTYYSIYSYMDQTNGYYKNLYATSELFDLYEATDQRRTLLVNPIYGPNYPRYQNFTNKFKSRTPGVMEGNIILIRSAQLLLIEAEAYVHKNQFQQAVYKLFELQKVRNPQAVKLSVSLTKDQLIDEIFKERRRELYGENGNLYFDYKCLSKTIKRTGTHSHLVTIEPNDVRWVFRIPQKEINVNVKITPADQNQYK